MIPSSRGAASNSRATSVASSMSVSNPVFRRERGRLLDGRGFLFKLNHAQMRQFISDDQGSLSFGGAVFPLYQGGKCGLFVLPQVNHNFRHIDLAFVWKIKEPCGDDSFIRRESRNSPLLVCTYCGIIPTNCFATQNSFLWALNTQDDENQRTGMCPINNKNGTGSKKFCGSKKWVFK